MKPQKGIRSENDEVCEQFLEDGFKNPPDDCGLFVRWWWFGPAVTKEELGRELEMMKSAGIGGLEIQPVYPLSLDDPEKGIRNLRYLSSEFLEAVRFAASRSRELGLTVDMTLGSGWPYGGPHISINLSAGQIRYEARRVHSHGGFCDPPELTVPPMRVDERLIQVLAARRVKGELDPASAVDLTSRVGEDESIEPDLSEGDWEIMFFIESHTLQEVKRPALGSEGYVLEHVSQGGRLETSPWREEGRRLRISNDDRIGGNKDWVAIPRNSTSMIAHIRELG